MKEEYIMKYAEYGLKITLEELRKLLEYAENRAQYDNMESCIYIKGGDRPTITQTGSKVFPLSWPRMPCCWTLTIRRTANCC